VPGAVSGFEFVATLGTAFEFADAFGPRAELVRCGFQAHTRGASNRSQVTGVGGGNFGIDGLIDLSGNESIQAADNRSIFVLRLLIM